MFGLDLSDDTTAELVKDWLKRKSMYIIGCIALIIALIGGLRLYEGKTTSNLQSQSDSLAELIKTANEFGELKNDDDQARAQLLERSNLYMKEADAVNTSSYAAQMARVQHAGLLLRNGSELALIKEALSHTIQSGNPLVSAKARIIYSKALWAANQHDKALNELKKIGTTFQGVALELKGDILFDKGEIQQARQAYQEATQNNNSSQLLQSKINLIPAPPEEKTEAGENNSDSQTN